MTLAPAKARADVSPAADIRLNGGLSAVLEGGDEWGLGFSGVATGRYGYFQGGLVGDWGGAIFGATHQLYAGAAGLAWRPGHFRLDALGVAGVILYSYDPCSLCAGPTTDRARWASPWVGTRAGVAYNFGASWAHFELGLAGLVGMSTSAGSDTATYYGVNFSGDTYRHEVSHDFPLTWQLVGLITAGVTFDLSRSRPGERGTPPAAL